MRSLSATSSRRALLAGSSPAVTILIFTLLHAPACGKRTGPSREPVTVGTINLPDAAPSPSLIEGEPTIDSPCPESCAAGACDGDTCRRCLLVIDAADHPGGHTLANYTGLTFTCTQMQPQATMTIVASGLVSTSARCPTWSSQLTVETRAGSLNAIATLPIDARDEIVYPVHVEGAATTNASGNIDITIKVGELASTTSADCGDLELARGFTVSIAER